MRKKDIWSIYIAEFKENNPHIPVNMIDYWDDDDESEGEADDKDNAIDYNFFYDNKLELISNEQVGAVVVWIVDMSAVGIVTVSINLTNLMIKQRLCLIT